MNVWILIGLGFDLAILLMVATWLIARRLNNAGYVDAAWSYGFGAVALLFFLCGGGDPLRKAVITVMVVIWSVRLGTHILKRLLKMHPREDERYAELRVLFPKRPWMMFFGFFQLQAVLIGLLSAPFAIIVSSRAPGLHALEIAAIILWAVAQGGEALADLQLKAFRDNPANKGKVCEAGLWRYSRHPNYFFEWLTWVAYFLFACAAPWGWLAIYCPALMLFFLLKVTGVPPAEAQSLKSRGDAYRDYQRRTSVFVPLPPKK